MVKVVNNGLITGQMGKLAYLFCTVFFVNGCFVGKITAIGMPKAETDKHSKALFQRRLRTHGIRPPAPISSRMNSGSPAAV